VVGSRIKTGIGGSQTFAQDAWTQANRGPIELDITAPATEAARQWQGWGTALKPALEPITVARKPLVGTVAENVLAHGTGALNIDGCRVPAESGRPLVVSDRRDGNGVYRDWPQGSRAVEGGTDAGCWPANLIHDGDDEVAGLFPTRESGSRSAGVRNGVGYGGGARGDGGPAIEGSTGSAARFFYTAKAGSHDRHAGCHSVPSRAASTARPNSPDLTGKFPDHDARPRSGNHHPTVKPTELMRYLCRLVTPPGGTVLDPYMGSGSTLKAAELEGFKAIGIEMDPDYVEIARCRIAADIPLFTQGDGSE
jgi:site-specific DNA-methyltransferase (adenine-specific)